MAIILVIRADHVLLDDWVGILDPSWHTDSIDPQVGKVRVRHTIRVRCVHEHIRDRDSDLLKQLLYVSHNQDELFVAIDDLGLVRIALREVDQSVSVTVESTSLSGRTCVGGIICRILHFFVDELGSTIVIEQLFVICFAIYQSRLENFGNLRYELRECREADPVCAVNN